MDIIAWLALKKYVFHEGLCSVRDRRARIGPIRITALPTPRAGGRAVRESGDKLAVANSVVGISAHSWCLPIPDETEI